MCDCKHENIEEETCVYQYYLTQIISTITTCVDCDEIIEEKEVIL